MSKRDDRPQNFMTCDFYVGVSNLLASIKGQNKELIVVVNEVGKKSYYGLLTDVLDDKLQIELTIEITASHDRCTYIDIEDITYIEWFVRDHYE